MSRSNPTNTNPATRFFQWSGSKGMLLWYDKSQEKSIEQKLPFEFLVLDELSTITGYNKQMEAGFWANEVRNTTKDEMFVRTKQGPFEAGLYANLTQTRSKGGKYAKSIYIAYKDENDQWVIANIKATGSCLSAWIDFSNKHATETGKITMTRGDAADAPTGQYFPPVFTWGTANYEEDDAAKALDSELQIYLNQYMAMRRDEEGREIESDEPVATLATPEQQADFERRKAEAGGKPVPSTQVDDVIIEDISDEPIDLNDIPF